MATTDNELNDLIINDISQEEYDNLVATGQVQEGQIYATDGAGGGGTTGGLESVAHDSSLEGAGTTASPLKVASTVIAQINNKADGAVVETLSSVVSENTTKLNTLRNDTDSLGDQVSGIEEKIPSSASATNQLATKADLPIGFDAAVVAELPATGEKGIIYLVPKDGEAPDVHDEYIWIDSEQKFEFIGSTAVDLTNYVKNTDYASATKAGVVKTLSSYGISTVANGFIAVNASSKNDILNKTSQNKPIVPFYLDFAVKTGMTTNTIALTDEEKTAAQDWLGIKQGASLPILMPMWSDHVINDVSWLRADTFSWQSGDVYKVAYEHLVADMPEEQMLYAWDNDIDETWYTKTPDVPAVGDILYWDDGQDSGRTVASVSGDTFITSDGGRSYSRYPTKDTVVKGTTKTDTIGDITITYYLADDGHKICLPDQESNIVALYEKTGAANYYLLDATNKQFKLPRKQKRTLIQAVKNTNGTWYNLYSDGWIEQGGTASSGSSSVVFPVAFSDTTYYFNADLESGGQGTTLHAISSGYTTTGCTVKEGQSGVAQRALTANAKWFACGYAAESAYASAGMRLEYYYVGNFEQSAIEQTAGLNTELFNGKADVDLNNINPSNSAKATIVSYGIPDYTSSTSISGNEFVAPCAGLILFEVGATVQNGAGGSIKVNGITVDYMNTTSCTVVTRKFAWVDEDDVVVFVNGAQGNSKVFFPLKGTK